MDSTASDFNAEDYTPCWMFVHVYDTVTVIDGTMVTLTEGTADKTEGTDGWTVTDENDSALGWATGTKYVSFETIVTVDEETGEVSISFAYQTLEGENTEKSYVYIHDHADCWQRDEDGNIVVYESEEINGVTYVYLWCDGGEDDCGMIFCCSYWYDGDTIFEIQIFRS